MMKPRVALAMMVKNRAKSVGAALESAKGLVDVYSIVDTGSTDGTDAICETYTRNLRRTTWTGDYAAHRNETLRAAEEDGADWAIILDSDETISHPGNLAETIAAAHEEDLDVILTRVMSVSDKSVNEVEQQIRVIRLGRGIHYRYRRHHQLFGWRGERAALADAMIRADYTGDMTSRHRSCVESLVPMRTESSVGSDEWVHATFYLARSHSMMNEHAKAVEYARDVVQHRTDAIGYCTAWVILLRSTLATSGLDEGLKVYTEARKHHDGLADLHYWGAVACLHKWAITGTRRDVYEISPQTSIPFIPKLAEAGPMIGMAFRRAQPQ